MDLMARQGRLKAFSLVTDQHNQSKGFCFFEYVDSSKTDAAIDALDALLVKTQVISCRRACAPKQAATSTTSAFKNNSSSSSILNWNGGLVAGSASASAAGAGAGAGGPIGGGGSHTLLPAWGCSMGGVSVSENKPPNGLLARQPPGNGGMREQELHQERQTIEGRVRDAEMLAARHWAALQAVRQDFTRERDASSAAYDMLQQELVEAKFRLELNVSRPSPSSSLLPSPSPSPSPSPTDLTKMADSALVQLIESILGEQVRRRVEQARVQIRQDLEREMRLACEESRRDGQDLPPPPPFQ